jgi:hypothetical protein
LAEVAQAEVDKLDKPLVMVLAELAVCWKQHLL